MFGLIGPIEEPDQLQSLGGFGGGFGVLINIGLNLLIVGAGIYALFNFIFAGYGFLSASGDPKKIQMAWAKIWQSILGLTLSAGGFIIAAIISRLIFRDQNFILSPVLPGV
ncbi:hypothetical protein IPM62_00470 [Candidatus Woesebacteria bacterium]|nr:MAG: hypothetical protein IPM62_00470 [Candidatus Woesebacteria bacterium]